jgi:hypothetical protein
MNDDVQKYIYRALTVFIIGVAAWVGFIFINACGFSLTCKRGAVVVERTPIPTLIPATIPAVKMNSKPAVTADQCRVAASDLIGAWVSANSPETDVFQFVDANGRDCEATFADVGPLFKEPNLWHSDSLSCVSCHSADMAISLAQLDLSSYAGIMSGSRRADEKSKVVKGTDILGGGNWKSSLLYKFLSTRNADIPGHADAISAGSFVFAGKPLVEPALVPMQTPTAVPKP